MPGDPLWSCPVCGHYYVHQLRLWEAAQVDGELTGWLAEAYEVGAQRHVDDPAWHRQRRPPDWVAIPRRAARWVRR
jgi:hypothetical protein